MSVLRRDVGIGIVHLGLGAFHRAHQAAYIDACLERNGGDWGIAAANIRSNRRLVELLEAQGCRYHLAAWADREHVQVREIGAIRRALFAGDDPRPLLDLMAAPPTRIVSLTVTEKAWCLAPATGELMLDAAGIAQDLRTPDAPTTAPGFVVAALERRRAAGHAPFTVLCCDNMPDNGRRAGTAVRTLAAARSPSLGAWIEREVAFPSTMVDRIVPAVTDAALERIAGLIGRRDPAAVSCEAFSQWVVEDRFCNGRPDFEHDGVELVADVRPFEIMKLRLLNGAHSLLAYLGLARGRTTVAEAIADSKLRRLVEAWFEEAAASLDPAAGLDPQTYARALLRRFANDALEHRLEQIASDGSQKIPQRWLEGALANLEAGRAIPVTVQAVAAWMAYVGGNDRNGRHWRVDDPLAGELRACHREHARAADIVDAMLALDDVFPARLAARADFRAGVREAFAALVSEGGHG